jgi:nitrous oxide reductase accessory protein NosL
VPKPGPKDLCPVCGMLVSKYPHWIATIAYKDGHAHHFDGAKDMFKFWFDPPKYAAGHSREMMVSIHVTDYYNLERIDAKTALYVVGSDVLGPMGHELVPLATQADAEDFMKEHKGKRILRFDQVTQELPFRLDDGKF